MDPDTAPAKAILQRWSKVRRPIEEALGLKKGQKAILGCYNGNPVYAEGSKNYIEKVCEMGEGKLGIEVRETVGCGTGKDRRRRQGPDLRPGCSHLAFGQLVFSRVVWKPEFPLKSTMEMNCPGCVRRG